MKWPALGKEAQIGCECQALGAFLISYRRKEKRKYQRRLCRTPVLPPHNEAASTINCLLSGAHGDVESSRQRLFEDWTRKRGEKTDKLASQGKSSLWPPTPSTCCHSPSSQLMFLSLLLVLSITRTSSIMHVCVCVCVF